MNYTMKEAVGEQEQMVAEALQTRDSEKLYTLAQMIKEQGDDEWAEELLVAASRIEEMEPIEGKEEREAYEAECHFAPSEGFKN